MLDSEIPQIPPPPAHLVKAKSRMCLDVLGWINGEFVKVKEKLLGIERPIGGVLITSRIIFMMGCIWSMILEMVTNHGRKSLKKRRLAG